MNHPEYYLLIKISKSVNNVHVPESDPYIETTSFSQMQCETAYRDYDSVLSEIRNNNDYVECHSIPDENLDTLIEKLESIYDIDRDHRADEIKARIDDEIDVLRFAKSLQAKNNG